MAKLRLLLKRSGKAFTFVELLIAMVIVAIVSGAVIMLGYTYFNHFEQSTELSMARERGIMVATYLENRLLNSSLGMPGAGSTEGDFKAAFTELLYGNESYFLEWDETVNVVDDDSTLLVAWSAPSGSYTTESYVLEQGEPIEIEFDNPLDPTKVSNDWEKSTEGWVVFPGFNWPLRVMRPVTGTTLTLQTNIPRRFLSANEQLHYVRFLRAYVDNGYFKVEDLTRQSPQSIVEGILNCKFLWDPDIRVLTVAVLARGNKRFNRMVTPEQINGWPDPISDEHRYYYLALVRKGWRLRN